MAKSPSCLSGTIVEPGARLGSALNGMHFCCILEMGKLYVPSKLRKASSKSAFRGSVVINVIKACKIGV